MLVWRKSKVDTFNWLESTSDIFAKEPQVYWYEILIRYSGFQKCSHLKLASLTFFSNWLKLRIAFQINAKFSFIFSPFFQIKNGNHALTYLSWPKDQIKIIPSPEKAQTAKIGEKILTKVKKFYATWWLLSFVKYFVKAILFYSIFILSTYCILLHFLCNYEMTQCIFLRIFLSFKFYVKSIIAKSEPKILSNGHFW